jgi:hypothetical protein
VTCDDTRLRPHWLTAIRRYLVAVAIGNLLWETAQLPLYTLWRTGTPAAIAGAVLHCTLGDIVIALIALMAALVLVGAPAWPDAKFASVMVAVVIGAAGYTIYSEYVNTVLHSSWAYSEWMPTLPFLGTGLAPFAQALTVPACALVVTRVSPAPL